MVAEELSMKIKWRGKGKKEKCYDLNTKKIIIECDKSYFRPLDVNTLLGDAKKARIKLKWKPKISFNKGIQDTINWYISNTRWLKYCSKKYKGQRLGLND